MYTKKESVFNLVKKRGFQLTKIIVQTLTKEKRFAIFQNNQIEQIVVEQPKHQSLVGNIYYGTVSDIIPGMNAAFVDIGEDKKGYLYRNKLPAYVEADKLQQAQSISQFLHQGEKIIVQIEKDATGTKGPRLTAIVELEGELLIYLPHGHYVAVSKKINENKRQIWREIGQQIKTTKEGIILRTACQSKEKHDLQTELTELRDQYIRLKETAVKCKKPTLLLEKDLFFERLTKEINERQEVDIIVDQQKLKEQLDDIYEHDPLVSIKLAHQKDLVHFSNHVDRELEKALKRVVWLSNGAYIVFDETEACTVIDVNTGKYVGKSNHRQTVLQVNELAMKEIARQIRLRDIGGIILVDFIDMKMDEDRTHILKIAQQQLAKDRKRSHIVGFTELGILQITRKKTNISLAESLTETCPVCHGTGTIPSVETTAFQLERLLWEYRFTEHEAILIEATEDVINVFVGKDDVHLKRLEEVLHVSLYVAPINNDQPSFAIRQFGTKREIEQTLARYKI